MCGVQEGSSYSSWVSTVEVVKASEYSLPCMSAGWKTSSAKLKCGGAIGGKAAIEVADGGGWTHAYYELPAVVGTVYEVRGELFAEAEEECDGSAKVMWCSPSVVVCGGAYDAEFYNTGGCMVGVRGTTKGSWAPFSAYFLASSGVVTVYIPQVTHQMHTSNAPHASLRGRSRRHVWFTSGGLLR